MLIHEAWGACVNVDYLKSGILYWSLRRVLNAVFITVINMHPMYFRCLSLMQLYNIRILITKVIIF